MDKKKIWEKIGHTLLMAAVLSSMINPNDDIVRLIKRVAIATVLFLILDLVVLPQLGKLLKKK